jgi:hypothetical protein
MGSAVVADTLAKLALTNQRLDVFRLALEQRVDLGFVGHR